MTDIAALGFAIDSAPVDRASSSLDKLTGAARMAEAASKGVTASSLSEAAAIDRTTAAANRGAAALRLHAAASRMAGNDARMLGFQINDIAVSLASGMNPAMVALQQGSQIAQLGLRNVATAALSIARSFAPVLVIGAAVGAVFAGLATKINETAKTQVSFGDVFMATVQTAAESIGEFFQPAIAQLGTWWQQFVDWITPLFKNVVNVIVGTFVFGFNAVKDTWSLLPDAFASIFTKAMNGAIDIVQNGINAIIGPINGLLEKVGLAGVPLADLSGFKGTPSGADEKVGDIISRDAASAFSTDFAGQAFDAISQRAQQLALAEAAEKAKNATKGTSDTIKGPLTDGIDKLAAKTNAWAEAATSAFSNMGSALVDAFTKGGNIAGNVLDMLLSKVGDFGTSLLDSGLNALLNMGVNAITGALSPTGGVLGNGLWGTAIFGGARAAGGPVNAGAAYMVGEKGPEWFVPRTSGTIVPNGAANQNGGGHLTVTVISEVRNGNLVPVITQISGRVAGQVVQQQAPASVAAAQRNRIVG